MMGDEFRLGQGDRRELPAQDVGDLPVQDLPPARACTRAARLGVSNSGCL